MESKIGITGDGNKLVFTSMGIGEKTGEATNITINLTDGSSDTEAIKAAFGITSFSINVSGTNQVG